MFNKAFRIFMHLATLGLFISAFFMKDCDQAIYPKNFIAVTIIIITHQVYDVYLACNNYMIDFDNLPPTSTNRLRYNKELFQKQSKCLLWANLLFGCLSILTVAAGYFIVNK